jgi:hypothetical protein
VVVVLGVPLTVQAKARGLSGVGRLVCAECRHAIVVGSRSVSAETVRRLGVMHVARSSRDAHRAVLCSACVVLGAQIVLFGCGHAFHRPCLGRSHGCPLCHQEVSSPAPKSRDNRRAQRMLRRASSVVVRVCLRACVPACVCVFVFAFACLCVRACVRVKARTC